MSVKLVSRYKATIEWMATKGLCHIDQHQVKLDLDTIQARNVVTGNLPIQLVAAICIINVPLAKRGIELSVKDLEDCEAKISEFSAKTIGKPINS